MNYVFILIFFTAIRILFSPLILAKNFASLAKTPIGVLIFILLQYLWLGFIIKLVAKYSLYLILLIFLIAILRQIYKGGKIDKEEKIKIRK